jgi:flagellar assembly protein FliH
VRGLPADNHSLQALEPARRAGDDGRSEAEVGYTAGFAAGYQDGLAEAAVAIEAETQQLRARLDRAMRAMSAAATELAARQATDIAGVEDALAAAAVELAEAILGRELELAKTPGIDALARALALVPPAQAAVAHMNPADLCDLDPGMLGAGRDLTLVADPGVEPGGCILAVGDSRIDAQLGPALDRVRAALSAGGSR